MQEGLRVLHLEDDPLDADLIQSRLRGELPNCDLRWVTNRAEFESALEEPFDLILSDYGLPDYDGLGAVKATHERQPDTPIILVTGTLSEDEAVKCVTAGATDYMLKSGLQRLAPAVARALREAAEQRERRRAEQELQVSQERLKLALEAADVCVWEYDVPSGRVVWTRQFGPMLGYTADEAAARMATWRRLIHPSDVRRLGVALERHRRGDSARIDIEFRVRAKDGSWRWVQTVGRAVSRDASGRALRLSGTHRDVSERKAFERELEYRVNYDVLTGLASKSLLVDRIRHAIALASRHSLKCALLCLDLDRFKLINDSLGHSAGDEMLKRIAERLKHCIRGSDALSRLGGDEFAVVLEDLEDPATVGAVAHKILETVQPPLDIEGHEFFTTASIGIAVFPEDGQDPQTLLKNADTAMYRAKQAGRNRLCFYADHFNQGAVERLKLEADLRRALVHGEFELHYQPRVDLASGRVTSLEALVRWRNAERGLVPPAQFVPLAEETGVIVPIGLWVLQTACGQMRIWCDAGYTGLRVAVNLSPLQFRQPDLADAIRGALGEHDLAASHLELEITEGAAMDDPQQTQRVLEELHAMGIAIAIDDFGTGYSSLGYLQRFPLQYLKIDQSFVRGVPGNAPDEHLVRSIIGLAHNMELGVIAEGVETEAQRAFLETLDCDEAQGYLLCRPQTAADLEAFLGATAVR